MIDRELQVRQHHAEQALGRVVLLAQRQHAQLEQQAETFRRDRREVGDLAVEVVQRRGLRHAHVARRLAQAQRRWAQGFENLDAAPNQCIAQVAVVVGARLAEGGLRLRAGRAPRRGAGRGAFAHAHDRLRA